MIYLIHGDHQSKSREFLNQKVQGFKKENREIIRLSENLTLELIKQALESHSLFGKEKAVIIENLFSKKSNKDKKIIDYLLKEKNIKPTLVIWETKQIDGRRFKKTSSSWQKILFKTPRVIFKFLESLKTRSPAQVLGLLKESLAKNEPEFIFYMLIRQARLLLLAKDNHLQKMAPWQKANLARQAEKFTPEELIKLHKKLLEIDTKIKTGKTLMPLGYHLDLLIVSL